LFEWMDSPRGQLSDEVREATWQRLEKGVFPKSGG
jgi:hypothetical protein